MSKHSTKFCGLDIGDRFSWYQVLDDSGDSIESGRVKTTRQGVVKHFGERSQMRVVMEVGAHSRWISKLLVSLGHEVVVANARNLAFIFKNHKKNDRNDAELLARVGRFDPELLSPIQHRSQVCGELYSMAKSRDVLVRSRTQLINHVRGTAKAHGWRVSSCGTQVFAKRATDDLPEELLEQLNPVLEMIAHSSAQIRKYDKRIDEAAERFPEIMLLRQIPGVGPLTALVFYCVIADPKRFSKSRNVGAYVGLCPRQDQSGDRDRQLRISKCGDPMLRRLLVQCAQYILGAFGKDSDLRRFGDRLAARGGKNGKKRALVAVARKLSVLMLALWKSGQEYEPLRNAGKAMDSDRAMENAARVSNSTLENSASLPH